jgi:hypothetical protein
MDKRKIKVEIKDPWLLKTILSSLRGLNVMIVGSMDLDYDFFITDYYIFNRNDNLIYRYKKEEVVSYLNLLGLGLNHVNEVLIGIDSNLNETVLVFILDGRIYNTIKCNPEDTGHYIVKFLEMIKYERLSIGIGNKGPNLDKIMNSLEKFGLNYILVNEWGTSKAPKGRKDIDLHAAVKIAFKASSI